MIELTPEQQGAVDGATEAPARLVDTPTGRTDVAMRADDFAWIRALLGDEPEAPRRIDPRTGMEYALLPQERYERFKAFFEEDPLSPAERRALFREAGKRAGWDSPRVGCTGCPAGKPMSLHRGEVVRVDWPYSDRTGSKVRPAVVVQDDTYNKLITDTILVLISRTQRALLLSATIVVSATGRFFFGRGEPWLLRSKPLTKTVSLSRCNRSHWHSRNTKDSR